MSEYVSFNLILWLVHKTKAISLVLITITELGYLMRCYSLEMQPSSLGVINNWESLPVLSIYLGPRMCF